MARATVSGFLVGSVMALGGMAAVSVLQVLNAPLPEAANKDMVVPQVIAEEMPPEAETATGDAAEAATVGMSASDDARPDVGPEVAAVEIVAPEGEDIQEADAPQLGSSVDGRPEGAETSAPEVMTPKTDALSDAPDVSTALPADPDVGDQDVTAPQTVAPIEAPEPPVVAQDLAPDSAPAAQPTLSGESEPAVIVAMPTVELPARPALPKIGGDQAAATVPGTPATRLTDRSEGSEDVSQPAVSQPAAVPPLQAYAVPFDNPENKPLMSIILLDRGTSDLGLEALAAFPYPLTFAVDVTSPEALTRMEQYRAAGFEVMALSDMPLGATAGDTETLLRAALREVPEVVAVMEGDATGLQSDKAISDQVTSVLQETGHGAVFFASGLNTAQKLASKNGVAAASVFRDFDGKGQSATVMRRFLDQAAFKARQQPDGVVMVGRLQPETISALLLWGLQDRATRVALAPISAVLQQAGN